MVDGNALSQMVLEHTLRDSCRLRGSHISEMANEVETRLGYIHQRHASSNTESFVILQSSIVEHCSSQE